MLTLVLASMRLPRCAPSATILLVMLACSPPPPPTETAARYVQAQLTGDRVTARSLISAVDSADLAAPELRDLAARAFGEPDAGSPGSRLDSARTAQGGVDTATVLAYLSVPNWETVGGRYRFEGGAMIDRAHDAALVASLPLIARVDTVELVRERSGGGARWRVLWRARFQHERWVYFERALSYERSAAERSEAARALRQLYQRHGRTIAPGVDSSLREGLLQAAYADSIDTRVAVVSSPPLFAGAPTRQFTGWVRNRSRRAIASVWIDVVFTSGERTSAHASDIAPGASKKPLGFGNWSGAVASHRVTRVELAP